MPAHDKPKSKSTSASTSVPPVSKIVESVGIAVKLPPGQENRAKLLEKAMSDAVLECSSQGISDPDKVREAMRVARETVKAELDAAVAKASDEANQESLRSKFLPPQ